MATSEQFQALVDTLSGNLTEVLGENLYSCVLSVDDVRGDVAPDPKDLSIFIILNESTPGAHAAIAIDMTMIGIGLLFP